MENEKSGPGIWPETLKNEKMKNAHCRILIVARKLKNVENETQTLYDLEYCKKHLKTWKMRNAHCGTWITARNLKNVEKENWTL